MDKNTVMEILTNISVFWWLLANYVQPIKEKYDLDNPEPVTIMFISKHNYKPIKWEFRDFPGVQ